MIIIQRSYHDLTSTFIGLYNKHIHVYVCLVVTIVVLTTSAAVIVFAIYNKL